MQDYLPVWIFFPFSIKDFHLLLLLTLLIIKAILIIRPYFIRHYVLSLAQQAEAKDEFEQARIYYASLIKRNDADAEAWNKLGLLILKKGYVQAAGEAFEKAVSSDPGYEPAKFNLQQWKGLVGK